LANTASAEKRNRQAQKRRARNVQTRTAVKGAVKKVRDALTGGDAAAARASLSGAEKALSKALSKGVIHKNAAARRISRLAKAVAKSATAPATAPAAK
jgi:small subunit ribosomal protein S20